MAVPALTPTEDALSLYGYLERFERRERRRELSPETLRTYGWAIRQFLAWCAEHGLEAADQLTRPQLEGYQDLLLERGLSPKSRSVALTALRQFLTFLVWAEAPVDPRLHMYLDAPRLKPSQPKPIPDQDLAKIRDHLLELPPRAEVGRRRTRALFFTLLVTAGRVSEVLQMRREGWERSVVRQKGGSRKELVVGPPVDQLVREWLEVRSDFRSELWITLDPRRPAGPLRSGMVREEWIRLSRRLHIGLFTTHQIRHTALTLLAAGGYDRGAAADFAGHHGLASIQGYTAYGEGMKEQARTILGDWVGAPPAPPAPGLILPLRSRTRARRPPAAG